MKIDSGTRDIRYRRIYPVPVNMSDLVRSMVDCVGKVSKMPEYIIDMRSYHEASTQRPCRVCAAGAFAVIYFDIPRKPGAFSLSYFLPEDEALLRCLNELRRGEPALAATYRQASGAGWGPGRSWDNYLEHDGAAARARLGHSMPLDQWIAGALTMSEMMRRNKV